MLTGALLLGVSLCADSLAQTPAATATPSPQTAAAKPSPTPQPPAPGVISVKAGLAIEGQAAKLKPLQRKRLFLIKASVDDLAELEKASAGAVVSRDCYYRSRNASDGLLGWLKKYDCETVYCREIQREDIDGVKEFREAFARGQKQYGSDDVARKWISVNLPQDLRIGFYETNQKALRSIIARGQETKKAVVVQSVMTDRNGRAYFTDVEPGTYVISNIVPTELDKTSILWNCAVKVSEGTTNAILSDKEGKPKRCVGTQQPLPACSTVAAK